MSEEQMSLREELRMLRETIEEDRRAKPKKFKIPLKARLNKVHLRKGFITVQVIDENRNITFRREPIIDGTIKLDDTIHAVDDLDIFFYKGKPFIHQPKKYIYSYNPMVRQRAPLNSRSPFSESNTTYGQKYVMARMESDKIATKKKIGLTGIVIFGLIVAAIVAYYVFTGGTG